MTTTPSQNDVAATVEANSVSIAKAIISESHKGGTVSKALQAMKAAPEVKPTPNTNKPSGKGSAKSEPKKPSGRAMRKIAIKVKPAAVKVKAKAVPKVSRPPSAISKTVVQPTLDQLARQVARSLIAEEPAQYRPNIEQPAYDASPAPAFGQAVHIPAGVPGTQYSTQVVDQSKMVNKPFVESSTMVLSGEKEIGAPSVSGQRNNGPTLSWKEAHAEMMRAASAAPFSYPWAKR